MKITANNAGQFGAIVDAAERHFSDSANHAVERAGAAVRDDLRAQTRSAGLGPNLERAWTVKRYANGTGINFTALVYSKAARIIEAFSADTVITARNAKWLVIPLEAAIARGFGKSKNRKWGNVEAAIDALGRLAFVPLAGNRALLVHRERSGRPTPFFLLLKRVSLKRRLDIAGEAGKAAGQLRDALLAGLGAA